MAMVTKHQTPDSTTWASHPCEVIKPYGAYLDAHLGAKRRTNDKNYETEKEELGPGRRKKTPSKRLAPLENENENKKGPKIRHADEKSSASSVVLPPPPDISIPIGSSKTFQVGNKPVTIISGSTPSSKQISSTQSLNIMRKNKGSKVSDLEGLRSLIDSKNRRPQRKQKKEKSEEVSSKTAKGTPHKKFSEKDQTLNGDEEMVSLDLSHCDDEPGKETAFSLEDGNDCIDSWQDSTIPSQVTDDLLERTGSEVSFSQQRAAGFNSIFERPASKEPLSEMQCLNASCSKSGTAVSNSVSERPASKDVVSENHFLNPSSSTSGTAVSNSAFQGQVIRYFKTLDRKLEDIAINQAKLNLYLLPNEKVVNSPAGMPTCPLLTTDSLETIENYLKDEENLATMCVYLSSHVSKNPAKEKDSTKKVLTKLLGNSLAKEFSFRGRRGKLNFSAHPLWKVVKGALCCKLENSDLSEAEDATKLWLKDAPYRTQEDGTERQRETTKPSNRSQIPSDSD